METTGKEYRKIVQLTFPPVKTGQPVMCHLVLQFEVTFNIVAAQTMPGKEGYLTLEIWGNETNCKNALQYLQDEGIGVVPVRQHVSRKEDSCMHCGLCLALCPVDALSVGGELRLVFFDEERCTACGMCTRICPVNAMQADIGMSQDL